MGPRGGVLFRSPRVERGERLETSRKTVPEVRPACRGQNLERMCQIVLTVTRCASEGDRIPANHGFPGIRGLSVCLTATPAAPSEDFPNPRLYRAWGGQASPTDSPLSSIPFPSSTASPATSVHHCGNTKNQAPFASRSRPFHRITRCSLPISRTPPKCTAMATHRLIRPLVVLLAVWGGTVIAGPVASAGEYNEVLSIGDVAPAWSELPGVDGRKHSLKDLADKQVVVVVFTCNSCPVGDRLRRPNHRTREAKPVGRDRGVCRHQRQSGQGGQPPKHEGAGRVERVSLSYLFDETQKIAKAFGANFTPEFFVLNKDRKVVYMGSLDDHSDPKLAKQPYLAAAIQAAHANQPANPAETLAIGCRIRYVRERK